MAVGRTLLLKKNSTVIAGLRSASLSWSGESIDLTTGEDSGKRLLEALSAQEQIDISAEGLMKEEQFRALVLGSATKMLTDIEIEFPILDTATNSTEATLTGNFRISSFEEGAPYNDAITFSISLESSGAWTYTPEAV
jgi:TP901-1 family phage major tail protein